MSLRQDVGGNGRSQLLSWGHYGWGRDSGNENNTSGQMDFATMAHPLSFEYLEVEMTECQSQRTARHQ